MAGTDFYAAYSDEKLAANLFAGWGYNFYRAENQLRADDLMVRAKVGEMLGAARASVAAAEASFRQAYLPPPTRAHPLPDPQAVRQAQSLEAIGRELGALEGQIRALPVPETDRMTQRLRGERETLERLLAVDRAMVATAHQVREATVAASSANILERAQTLSSMLAALEATLRDRRDLLAVHV